MTANESNKIYPLNLSDISIYLILEFEINGF